MSLALLTLLWMAWLRSGRSEQARFARVAAALRAENIALGDTMRALGQHLADAQKQLSEQAALVQQLGLDRSEEHTSELQSLMRISYAVFCLKKKKKQNE